MRSLSLNAFTRSQSVSLGIFFILPPLLAARRPERDHAHIVATLGVDQRQQFSMDDSQSEIHPSQFAATVAHIRALVGTVVDEVGVSEVEPMLLQIRLSLCLIPDK